LKSLKENTCKKDYRYERLYRNLYNPEFYLLAYKNIAASQGSMTAGPDGITLDGMSMARINKIIAKLKDHSYQPSPARRTYIAKKSNPAKKRPLGIPSTDDKLVQEIVRMILEAIYEPTFSNKSHGFRPNRSCHTALIDVQTCFNGVKWIIEGDIKACFDSFDHHVLINLLRKRIKDEYFISLMWKFLGAGYMEQWEYRHTYSGTPQGSGMSPILANIYLSELDTYMGEYKQNFDTAAGRRTRNKEYRRIEHIHGKCKKKLKMPGADKNDVKEFKAAQKLLLSTSYTPAIDPNFKRIQYNRYADDFVIGVIGSIKDAEMIKADVKEFLHSRLKLTMSEEKTKVTHSGEMVRYLGYDITVSRSKDYKRAENGALQRMWYGNVNLYVPHEKWVSKLHEYKALKIKKDNDGKEIWKPIHRGKLMNQSEIDIISKFNSEIRGIYNYYRLANNATVLSKFYHIMKGSMLKTLAAKGNTTVTKVLAKHVVDGVFVVEYSNKAGKQSREFYHDGFEKKTTPSPTFADVLPQFRKYERTNSFAKRLRAGVCEVCGAKTEDIRIHHVRTLKELTGKTVGELLMMEKRKKSLALCNDCFEAEHV
jgi:group II intron reverse transcriptase/maturase